MYWRNSPPHNVETFLFPVHFFRYLHASCPRSPSSAATMAPLTRRLFAVSMLIAEPSDDTLESTNGIKNTKIVAKNHSRRKLLLLCSLCLYMVVKMCKSEFVVEMFFTDIFLKAKVFMTFRYLQVRYVQPKPRYGEWKTFVMSAKNAFVFNLDSDTERMQQFWDMNQNATIQIQRFSASAWQPPFLKNSLLASWRRMRRSQQQQDQGEAVISPLQQTHLDQQAKWAQQYPWLASTRARNREKGCSLSHIRLLQDFVLEYQNYTISSSANDESDDDGDDDSWYRFVFEDDGKLMEPLLSQGSVTAPVDADVVFLSQGVVRAVKVPYQQHQQDENLALTSSSSSLYHQHHYGDYAVRVITGWGTQGYVITLRGAIKVLHCLSTYSQPVDIVLLKSCSASLRIYLPNESTPSSAATSTTSSSWWSLYRPQVMHGYRPSTITSHS
jgi:GR25 family glycosyltransferase involved in LPS biosynthesis